MLHLTARKGITLSRELDVKETEKKVVRVQTGKERSLNGRVIEGYL